MTEIIDEKLDWMNGAFELLVDGIKMKGIMRKKGLTRAKAKCKKCTGHLQARISSYNGHIHIECDGPCKRIMME
jgi:hypothetical protein